MNVKDLFAKAENGTLNYDQFVALTTENKVKFADLSEGGYVDKNKYNDEINSLNAQLKTLNDTINQRDNDLTNLKQQLKDAGQDATKLADLTNQFTTLQTKYDNDVKDYQAQLAKQKYDYAVKTLAGNEKFTSNAAKNFFIETLSGANLAMEGEKIVGVDDFITKYKAENADSFVVEQSTQTPPADNTENKLPKFAGPTSAQTGNPEVKTGQFGFNFRGVR